MILVVDMNYKQRSLGFYEFVLPIIAVVATLDDYAVKHFSDVEIDDVNNCG
jgi:hypothetical protein